MATIGNLSVKMVAQTAPFAQGMTAAEKATRKFQGAADTAGRSGKQLGKTCDEDGGLLANLAGGFAASGILIAAKALHIAARAAVRFGADVLESIHSTNQLADSLGVSTQGLTGLHTAARRLGVDTKAVDEGLAGLNAKLGSLENGSLSAADAFARVGLSADQLANLPADKALSAIADKLQGIADPTQRAAAAFGIFGKDAAKLLPLLANGAGGLDAFNAEAAKLGLAFGREQGEQVDQATASVQRLLDVLTGLGTQLAVQIAPFVQAAADKLAEFGAQGGSVGEPVTAAFASVGMAVATVIDTYGNLKILLLQVEKGFISLAATAVDSMDKATAAGGRLGKLLGSAAKVASLGLLSSDQGTKDALAQSLADIQSEIQAIEKQSAGKAVGAFFDSIKQKAAEAAKAAVGVKQAGGAVAAVGRNMELFGKAQQTFDATRNPLEKFQERMAELGAMLDKGAISWDTYGRAGVDALSQLEKANGDFDIKRPEALLKGSREAQSVITKFDAQQEKNAARQDPAERIAKALELAKDLQKAQLKAAQEAAVELKKLNGAKPPEAKF
jgi:uncharacterized protein YukE